MIYIEIGAMIFWDKERGMQRVVRQIRGFKGFGDIVLLKLTGGWKGMHFSQGLYLGREFLYYLKLVTKKFKHIKAKFSLLLALLLGATYILSFR